MRNCILIISHKRPQCQTAKAVIAAGYGGDWFIVADDADDTDYEGLYAGHVLRFSKQEYFEKVDTIDNFKKMNTPVYARKFCFDFAQKEGYDCFGLFDDDIKYFKYRYKCGKSLPSKKVQNLTQIFDAYCEYIVKSGFACGGFMNAARLIGGLKSTYVSGFYYNPTNLYIINAHIKQKDFAGTLWEDTIYCYTNNMLGNVVTSFGPIAFVSAPPCTAAGGGGMSDAYSEAGAMFIAKSYLNIAIPSFIKAGKGIEDFRISKDVPQIISGRWKK